MNHSYWLCKWHNEDTNKILLFPIYNGNKTHFHVHHPSCLLAVSVKLGLLLHFYLLKANEMMEIISVLLMVGEGSGYVDCECEVWE